MTAATDPTLALDAIETAIDAIARGEMIVVVDDEDRENEGDLIMAAERATPEAVAFMVRHTTGILCVPMEAAEAKRLRLPPMVAENDAPLATAFTVSVDVRRGLTTGISAVERCNTIRALADPASQPEDFVRPGHIFPLVAREGGVLMRTGHTEAAIDFNRLAGLRTTGLLAELVNDDGTVMKGHDIEVFAREHRLALVSIDALIAHRRARETLISRVGETTIDTPAGPAQAIEFSSRYDTARHIALVFGDVRSARAPLVRIQQEDPLRDVFGGEASKVTAAMRRIAAEGAGVLIYLRDRAAGVVEWGKEDEDNAADKRSHTWRDVGLGAQIMRDLGLTRVRVLSSRQREYVGVAGFGVEIEDTLIL
jgi:3,4-dihydroxy 2-butanone 4-phosphate synthase/GTP cyclohydrolase II